MGKTIEEKNYKENFLEFWRKLSYTSAVDYAIKSKSFLETFRHACAALIRNNYFSRRLQTNTEAAV